MNRQHAIYELRLWIGLAAVIGPLVFISALAWVNRPRRRHWSETRRAR